MLVMNRFKKGQEIICIRDTNLGRPDKIYKGRVYTLHSYSEYAGGIHLEEMNMDNIYNEARFEPVKYDDCTKELAEVMVKHLGGKKEELQKIEL